MAIQCLQVKPTPLLPLSAGLGLLAMCLISLSAPAAVLEEIIVTAQKRDENLQDVPIAVSVVTGENIREAGVMKMEDLAPAIPNFQFAEAVSGSDNIFIRGIGSGINFGFEQAVGQVVDGFFFGRSRFGRATFLDLERVEILKGPQGALIGKNTSAGAINITTAQPTDEFEGWITPTYEFEASEGYSVEGALSGPITDSFMGRIALRVDDRDGYVENVATGEDQQSMDDVTVRVKLLWEPTDKLDATLMYQFGDFERRGRTRQLSLCGDLLRNFDPDGPGPAPAGALFGILQAAGEDCAANYSRNIVNFRNGVPTPELFDLEFDIAGLTVNWQVGELTLTSLTGYSEYDANDEFDIDATIREIGGSSVTESFEQLSQELRLTSPAGGSVEYIAGLYFLHTEQEIDFSRHFFAVPPPLMPATSLIRTHQESDTFAVFGQATWNFSDSWNVTIGARFTDEDKDAQQEQFPTSIYTLTPVALMPPVGPAAAIHSLDQNRSESNFSPTVNLRWRPNDDTMIYGSVRRGFKGGGFDMQLDGNQAVADAGFQFENEDVIAYELGAKLRLGGGAAQFNAALFQSEFDDLQVSTIDAVTTTFNVGNAATATTQGLELDLTWAASDQFTLFAAIAFLESEYDSFPDGPCTFVQNPASAPGCVQDLSGQKLPYAPEVAGTINGEYVWSLTDNLNLIGFVQVSYSDEFALVLDLDPNLFQDSYTKVDARISLADADGRWNVSVIGRNLTDETTTNFGNDGLGGPFMAGSYFRMVDPPRSIALQGTWRF